MVSNKFLVGCDPEFLVLDRTSRHINVHSSLGDTGEVGSDHGGRVAEIRPKPSKSVYILLKHIKDILTTNKKLISLPAEYKFRGGARYENESIGGHVHLDINPFLDKRESWADGLDENYDAAPKHSAQLKKIIQALDLVTGRLEELDILPKNECAARRQGNYGKLGDVRYMDKRFEYRTMASWLYHPRTAYICLTAAKLAAVAPDAVFEILKKSTEYPWIRFKDWLDEFKDKDRDAARCRAKASLGITYFQQDPTADFRNMWEELP